VRTDAGFESYWSAISGNGWQSHHDRGDIMIEEVTSWNTWLHNDRGGHNMIEEVAKNKAAVNVRSLHD